MLAVLSRPPDGPGTTTGRGADRGSVWVVLRRPLFLALMLGCFVSVLASGRFTVRLILDGAVSFAFIPILEVLALTVVAYRGPSRGAGLPFGALVDGFCAGNTPWLCWLVAAMLVPVLVPPRSFGQWFLPGVLSAAIPAVLSVPGDVRFFRQTVRQPQACAIRSVIWHHTISWTLAVAYFLGIAIWSDTLPGLARRVGL